MGEYHPPTGGLDVAIPRTSGRIALQTFLIHACADFCYTHLCELVPRLRNDPFSLRCIQVLLLWHIPEYILVQCLTTLLAYGIEELGVTEQGPARFASLAGIRRFTSKSHCAEMKAIPWSRLPVLAVAVAWCWMGAGAYTERFSISYHQMSDVGNLGIDHRNGWVSFAGLSAGALALGLKICYWYRRRSTELADTETGQSQQVEEKEDKVDFDTFEVSVINLNLGHAVMLLEAFFAAVIHQIPLVATHRAISIISFLPATLVLIAVLAALASKNSRPGIARRASVALKWVLIVVIAWTIVEPSVTDLNEIYDVAATSVKAWSFRWQATDRFDRILRLWK